MKRRFLKAVAGRQPPFFPPSRRAILRLAIGFLGVLFLGFFPATQARAGTKVDLVVVKKSERKLILMKNGQVVKEYKVVLGSNPEGHKREKGDGRTPEGTYKLDFRNPASNYYKSIHLSYPNAKDREEAKKKGVDPGGDIFIHGTPNKLPKPVKALVGGLKFVDWTQGCIAVSNSEMDEIWDLVEDGTDIRIDP